MPPPLFQPGLSHVANLDSIPTMIVKPAMPPAAPPPSGSEATAAAPASIPVVYRPAEPILRVVPRIPSELLTTMPKPKTIEVTVAIDAAGQVTRAEVIPQPGVHKLTMEKLVTAARSWTFKPARKGDEPISSEFVLQFHFAQ
jgi:hypothetical protein